MKTTKLVVASAIAVLGLSSCGYSNEAKEVTLKTQADSLNYTLGVLNGESVKSQILAKDSSEKAFNEFFSALDASFKNDEDETFAKGKQIGEGIKASEKLGLFGDAKLTFNTKVISENIIKVLKNEKVDMTNEEASLFIRNTMMLKDSIEFTNEKIDSLNYAFGVSNGYELKMYIPELANDSTGKNVKTFVKGLKKGLSAKVKTEVEKSAVQFGNWLKMQKENGLLGDSTLAINYKLLRQAAVNSVKGEKVGMTTEEANKYLSTTMQKRQEAQLEAKYGKQKEENLKFLAENKTKKGVVTTESGLQYKVIKKGKGALPKGSDVVKVHYVGTLIDGTEFDSSVKRGTPAEFPVNAVIKGWTEALKMMPVGSKYQLFIPADLGYRAQGTPTIPPFSTLIFEVELLDIVKK